MCIDQVPASQKWGRFMIYVHAKGMVVDDEYVLLGSANINQRSIAGSRDTEIAMGAYQNHQTWSHRSKHPRGQVYGYRMSLWAEPVAVLTFKGPEAIWQKKAAVTVGIDRTHDLGEYSFIFLPLD